MRNRQIRTGFQFGFNVPEYLDAEQWIKRPSGPKKLSTAKNLMNPNLKRHYCKNVVHPDDLRIATQKDKKVIVQPPSSKYPQGRPRIIERPKA
jgi:hypothetical protein